jgi:hypothetical protein
MRNKPPDDKIEKLPKWAQEYIKDLEREREVSIRELNSYCDEQTESPFYTLDLVCTGENQGPSQKVRYIQTNKIEVNNGGVLLQLILRGNHICLSWTAEDFLQSMDVAFIPTGYQQASLVANENMR